MIFDITVKDNDFTIILEEFFNVNANDVFVFKVLQDELINSFDRYSHMNNVFNLSQDMLKNKNIFSKYLYDNLVHWITNSDLSEDTKIYLVKNLKVKASTTFSIKDENGEHLYVYLFPGRLIFSIIQ